MAGKKLNRLQWAEAGGRSTIDRLLADMALPATEISPVGNQLRRSLCPGLQAGSHSWTGLVPTQASLDDIPSVSSEASCRHAAGRQLPGPACSKATVKGAIHGPRPAHGRVGSGVHGRRMNIGGEHAATRMDSRAARTLRLQGMHLCPGPGTSGRRPDSHEWHINWVTMTGGARAGGH